MTASALAGLKLPFHFDLALLKRNLALIDGDEWSPHYNERDFGGLWQGVALRSATGSHRDIGAGHGSQTAFTNTCLMARCDYFREVLSAFPCPLKSVRLLSLAPGSFIREHSDRALGYEDGEVRIHIPIETNPGVEFYVCGERLRLDEADCYYVNVNLPHRVNNRGSAARIHLVIDALVDDWVRALFEECIANGSEIPRSSLPPGGFDEFADLIRSDPALRKELRAIPGRSDLIHAVLREAASRGFEFNEADIEAAFRSRPSDGSAAAFRSDEGWKPIRISLRESQPWATWICAPDHRFTEPFFEDSVTACFRNPFTALFRREMPLRPSGPAVPIHPQGFIFHMSRCGSTLISRSFAAAESALVISEPEPLDAIVRMNRLDWLEWIVSALGPAPTGTEAIYLLKLDSWHIRNLQMFRAAFPEVPWIFVYRDPLEVLVSHLNQPGLQTSPGAMDPAILGMRTEDITALTRRQWCVRVLEGFMTAALSFRSDPKGMFVNYDELPGAITGRIAKHFGLKFTPDDLRRVEAATRCDAKNPRMEFADDHEAKRKQIESLAPEAGLETLKDLYRQLEGIG